MAIVRSPVPQIARAVSLLRRAWRAGVPIAAYDLGALYEKGVRRGESGYWLAADAARATRWYRRGAAANEPDSLARLAQEEEDAAARVGAVQSRAREHQLAAFRYYAAAAGRAQREDWPDPIWRGWRYRRASLARRLAREGMMEQVARDYQALERSP
jgi:hypothetical protein